MKSSKPEGWKFPDTPCCRAVGEMGVDHYEPREPHAEDDGVDWRYFLGAQ
ncbi:MAG: hypothetical protein KF777_08805 [Planctomycetaceae bacterium]|nr:hypothetical protein [Planctomycetaceae bacterium]